NFLAIYHYQGLSLDDTISKRVLESYLNDLDYNRMFFLESDIREFKSFATSFDDDLMANPARLDKAFYIYNRYRQRLLERMDVIFALLKQDLNMNVSEAYDLDRHKQPWVKTSAELDDLWRRRVKEEILRFRLQDRKEA